MALLNFGARLEECKKATDRLLIKGIECTIVDARFAKPLDEKIIMELANNRGINNYRRRINRWIWITCNAIIIRPWGI